MAVAYSGGRDSTALLHATLTAAATLGVRVVALHVHHGLSPHADDWLAYGEAQCRRWAEAGHALSFAATRLGARPVAGESVEAWARRARYRALRAMALAAGADLVLLGHHRRDQAETVVLQALRGGGAAALSAMPSAAVREGITWARPWLDVPATAIEAYARRHRLAWVEDDSNADRRFARNRLRLDVWPALFAAFPDAEQTLATASRRAQQAAAVVDEIAALDRAAIGAGAALSIAAWRALSPARRAHALLAWLRERTGDAAPGSLVERLERELDAKTTRRWPAAGGELRSYRGALRWHAAPATAAPRVEAAAIDFTRPGIHACPSWGGALRIERVAKGGITDVVASRLVLRRRAPGDRFQAGPDRPPRSLKLQFQAAAVPEAARHGPVAVDRGDVGVGVGVDIGDSDSASDAGGRIVFVAGLGIDARAAAEPGVPQLAIAWLPSPPALGRDDPAG